jgi:hypothetical protein
MLFIHEMDGSIFDEKDEVRGMATILTMVERKAG